MIETQEERAEKRQRDIARRDAAARVDWNRLQDVHRAPSLTYVDGDGCGHVFLYGWSADRSEVITINADKEALQLTTTPKAFDLATMRAGLEVTVHVYDRPSREWPFCTDVVFPNDAAKETWRVTRGSITIQLSAPGIDPARPHFYRASIRIDGAEFMNDSGVRVAARAPIALTAFVGWVAG